MPASIVILSFADFTLSTLDALFYWSLFFKDMFGPEKNAVLSLGVMTITPVLSLSGHAGHGLPRS